MRAHSLAAVTIALAVVACSDATMPVARGPIGPAFSISDGAHSSGNAFFKFLPPMVANPGSGTNVTGLAPVVDICLLDGSACSKTSLAHFTTDLSTTTTTQPGNSETVRDGGDHYIVNWHTAAFDLLVGATYRVCVSVDGKALGHADVSVVGSAKDLMSVTNEYVGLLDDRTLPIEFRIEDGALLDQPTDQGCGGGTISGHEFNSFGGLGVGGWKITLSHSGQVIASTYTLDDGAYSFTGLPMGDYTVCEVSLRGIPQDLPTTGSLCDNGFFGYENGFPGYPITIDPDHLVWDNKDFWATVYGT
jgi:hypothetical protein